MPEPVSDMTRTQEVGYFSGGNNFFSSEEPLDINLRNLENLSLMDNFGGVNALTGMENNENLVYFQDFESALNPYIDDPKEGNISRTVRVPSSEHVAEIVGRQGNNFFFLKILERCFMLYTGVLVVNKTLFSIVFPKMMGHRIHRLILFL